MVFMMNDQEAEPRRDNSPNESRLTGNGEGSEHDVKGRV